MKKQILAPICILLLSCSALLANENVTNSTLKIVISDNGELIGQVFAMLGDVKAPLVGKVSLTDVDGKTISTSATDEAGNFAFKDIEPGNYKAVGVAGDYVGNTDIEVLSVSVGEAKEQTEVYTAVPLAVAPAPAAAIFDAYASLPAASFSSTPSFGLGGGAALGGGAGCSGCALNLQSYGCCSGGFNFRRLALLGGAIALPIALSGGSDDMATPDN